MLLLCHIQSVYRVNIVYKMLCFLCQEAVLYGYLQDAAENISAIVLEIGDPMDTPFSG